MTKKEKEVTPPAIFRTICGKDITKARVQTEYEKTCELMNIQGSKLNTLLNPSADNILARVFGYLREHPDLLYKVFTASGEGFSPADGFYFLAGFMGLMTPAFKSFSDTANLPGVIFNPITEMLILPEGVERILPSVESLLIGAAIGIGVVLTINVSRNIFKISHSDDYGRFYNSRMNRLRDESRVRVLNSDEILKNFLCPLTKNLPNCPMLAPNHCTYDNTAINLFLFTYPDLTPPGGKMVFIASQFEI